MSPHGDEPLLGADGLPFPDERDWLDLPAPPLEGLDVSPDFVDRTMRAIAALPPAATAPGPWLAPAQLRAFAPPPPSRSFVDDTLARLRQDRTQRWRELLARHVAPQASPEFVARTLAALAQDRAAAPAPTHRRRHWRFGLPLLALAAAALAWLALHRPAAAPLEVRLASRQPAAFAAAQSASPLAGLLATVDHGRDPEALAAGAPDPLWLVAGGER